MPVYKDGNSGTWRAQFYYTDWTGKKHKKNKRGFKTKKEAQQFEAEYIRVAKADMDMKLSSFVEIYLKDKKVELKQRTLRNKGYMIDTHVIPYLGDKKMNEITPADIIAWQKEIKEKNDFSESYLRMLQNQVTAIFIHASKIYCLKDNPCKRVKKMGRSDDRSLTFWTLEEYQKFIDTFDNMYLELVPDKLRELTYPYLDDDVPLREPPSANEDTKVVTCKSEGGDIKVTTSTKNTTKINNIDDNNHIYTEPDVMEKMRIYEEIIKRNIEYEYLIQENKGLYRKNIDEIVSLMVETVSIPKRHVYIGGDEFPYEAVKSQFLKLNYEHILYVITCMKNNTTKIKNIRSYLLTALYNAPNTIDSYYQAEVNHDLYGGF